MKLKIALVIAGLIGAGSLVVACGGGGSSMGGPTPPPVPTTPCISDTARQPLAATSFSLGRIGVRPPPRAGSDTYPGLIAVQYRSTARSPQAEARMSSIGARSQVSQYLPGWVIYKLPATADPIHEATLLRAMSGVASAEPVRARYLMAANVPNDTDLGTNALATQPGGDTTTPVQWDMWRTNMPLGWGITTGLATIRIAIIDTGYDATNADLAGKVDGSIVFDHGNGQAATCAGVTAQDHDGHGSNVSGIAAADTDNALGVAGTGWKVHLLEARVFPYPPTPTSSSPPASTADVAAGVNWAVANGAKVISLSLGGSTCPDDPVEATAIANAITAGVTVVAAAGNEGKNQIDAPACDPGVISVGASMLDDFTNTSNPPVEKIAAYSNFGAGLDVAAPGGAPTTTQQNACNANSANCDYLQWILNLFSSTAVGGGGDLALFAGTSQATPHVAGIAALMYSKDGSITPAAVKALFDTPLNEDDICSGCAGEGHGRVNANKLLTATH